MKRLGTLLAASCVLASASAGAASLRYTADQKGDFLIIGNVLALDCGSTQANTAVNFPVNTIGACGSNTSDTGRDVFWRSDEATAGAATASTAISVADARSTAMLATGSSTGTELPPGATVSYARLYWSASTSSATPALTATFERPGVFSTTLTAAAADRVVVNNPVGTPSRWYQNSVDVTDLVRTHGVGAYRVGNIAVDSLTNADSQTNYAAWALVVVYVNPAETVVRNISLFDGMDVIDGDGSNTDVTISGFLVPNSGFDAKLGLVSYEGDQNATGDEVRFANCTGGGAGCQGATSSRLTDTAGANTNVMNGRRSVLGANVGVDGDLPRNTGGSDALSGMDIDVFDVTSRMAATNSTAYFRARSTQDVFSLGVMITSISTLKPDFTTTTKTATNLTRGGGVILAGDTIEYTIVVTNTGTDTSRDTVMTDPLPSGVSFVPGSISVTAGPNAGAKTDAAGDDQAEFAAGTVTVRLGTGANNSTGGQLTVGQSTTVVFRVTVNAGVTGNLSNQAFINTRGVQGVAQNVTGTVQFPSGNGTPGLPTVVVVDPCLTDAHCPMATPRCDTAPTPNVCRVCVVNAHCGGTTPICDSTAYTCRGCNNNSECAAPTPLCNTVAGRCGECLTNADCPTSATCNTSTNSCQLAAPVVTSPTNGATGVSPTTSITGTGPANVTINVIIDGMVAGTTTTNGSGNWTFTPGMSLSSGNHTVAATATSTNGTITTTSPSSSTNAFTVASPPSITSNGGGASASINVAENTTAVTTVTATDPDPGSMLTYSISGTDAGDFSINPTTGVLVFNPAPNFEAPADANTDNVYLVTVQVSDGTFTDTQTLTVTVTNANEVPSISSNGGGASASISVAENTAAVTTVTATDPDSGAMLTYSISGTDAGDFSINPTTGVLVFNPAPNFEAPADANTDNVYLVTVQVSDGTNTDTQALTVTVTNANEAPSITSNGGGASASISVAENTAAVTTVTATDPDSGAMLTYSISGTDAGRFSINPATGVLVFNPAPNFESPSDADADNVYNVVVQVSDGTLTDTQALAVTVTNAGCQTGSCSGGTPVCDASTEQCERCLVDADCGGAPATCVVAMHLCTRPAPTVFAPADGSTINTPLPTYSGTATPNTTVNVFVDGMLAGTVTSDGAGNWSFTPTAGNELALGNHTVTANTTSGSGVLTATSPNGNTNTFTLVSGCVSSADCSGGLPVCDTSVAPRVCVRCLATNDCPMPATCDVGARSCSLPAPDITAPVHQSTINERRPDIEGTGPANATITITVDGAVIGTTTTDGSGDWVYMPSADLDLGEHTVTATATVGMGALAVTSPASPDTDFTIVAGCITSADCMGGTPVCLVNNTTFTNTCVRCIGAMDCGGAAMCNASNTCELAAPVVVAPANGSFTNVRRPPVSGTGPANANVEVFVDGMSVGTTTTDGVGAWSFTLTADLANGAHTARAVASIGMGALRVVSPDSNTNSFTVVDGCVADADCSGATPRCNTTNNTCVPCLGTPDCPTGATCSSGNQCVVAAPVVATPADGATINTPTPTYTGTGPANAVIRVSVDGFFIGSVTSDASGNWMLPSPSSLLEGSHTVSATATLGTGVSAVTSASSVVNTFTVVNGCLTDADCAGATPVCNTATNVCVRCVATADCPAGAACTGGFVCGLAAPVITSPTDGLLTSNEREPIVGTSVPNAVVAVFLDGVLAGTVNADGAGNWTYLPNMDLALGPHTVSAVASVGTGVLAVTSPSSPIVDFEVGCITNSDCSGLTPVCEPTTHRCVQCLEDAQCPAGTPICSAVTRTCTERCDDDTDCMAPTPVCAPIGNARAGQCVECVNDSRCAAPEPRCDVVTDTCVGCLVDADCPMGDRCDVSARTCVDCLANADCGGATPVCQQTTRTCRPCATDDECGGSTPLCSTSGDSAGRCVACRSNADCSGGTPICDGTSFTCRPCAAAGNDCSGDTPACETAGPNNGRCVECTSGNTTECAGSTPVCDADTSSLTVNTCVACLQNSDCPMDQRCNTGTRTCSPTCTMDSDCPATLPVCAPSGNVLAGQCVQCVQDNQCAPEQKCENTTTDTCVGCLMDSDCNMGRRCLLPQRTCEQCLTHADCPNTAPVCDPGSHTCRACTSNADCGGTTPVCSLSGPTTGQCTECGTNAECPADRPVCDATSRTCRPCSSNLDCFGDLLVCETTGANAGRCVECSAQDDSACETPRPVCNTMAGQGQNTCVGCLQDSDCPSQAPFCDASTRQCTTACNSNSQCSGNTPVCATSGSNNGRCVGCQQDGDCTGGERCDGPTNTCVACTQDSDCSAPTPRCEPTSRTCVACTGNADCPAADPVCDTSTHICRDCANDGECGGSTPVCSLAGTNAGRCVVCTSNDQCSGTTPRCDPASNTCVGCTADGDCMDPAAARCDTTTGLCASCTGDNQCGHLSGTPVCGEDGTCGQCSSVNASLCGPGGTCDVSASVCQPPSCGDLCDLDGDGFPDDSTSTGGCIGCTSSSPDFSWVMVLLALTWGARRRQTRRTV